MSKPTTKKTPPTLTVSSPGLPPQPQVNITHGNSRISAVLPTSESVEILLYGATILSWKDAKGAEKLWLSEAAKLDGTKAVRGGIPLVFPVFGTDPSHKETGKLPQHGFARSSRWEFLGKSTSESSALEGQGGEVGDSSIKLDFGLSPSNLSAEAREAWPFEFGLIYSVTLSRDGLTTSIVVRNEEEAETGKSWEFQVLMHSYLRVNDISDVSIRGLESSPFLDKVAGTSTTSPSAHLTLSSKTDRVYTPAGGVAAPILVAEAGKKKFGIVRDNLNEVVVWNPWIEGAKEIGDFAPKDGYRNMICVEAGAVRGYQKLEAGETFEGGQVVMSAN